MSFLIYKDDKQIGPFEDAEVRLKLQSGEFSPDHLGWKEGFENWEPLWKIFQAPSATPVPTLASSSQGDRGNVVIQKFLNEEQDPASVEKVHSRILELCTEGEKVLYIAVQKKLVVTISPESIVLTNRRFVIFRPKLMGMRMSFEDFQWRDVVSVHMKEGLLGATVTANMVGGRMLEVDCLPKAQARKLYSFAQEIEERMREERRLRELEDKRAAAGGVIVQSHPAISSLAAGKEDPIEVLNKLKQMLDANLISQTEYDAKKVEIIARL